MAFRRSVPVLLAALLVVLCYIVTKVLTAGQFWFHGIVQWQRLFRPFPDWGDGGALYGALLPAKWLGTRAAMHAAGFFAMLVAGLCCRACWMPALFACEAALIEAFDVAWLVRGGQIGWATAGARAAIVTSLEWIVLLLGAAWILAGQPPRARVVAPPPGAAPGPLARAIDRYFPYVCYLVAAAYAGMKLLFAYWWWFDSIGFWMEAFRPFPDWGTGAALFGAILPARWIGSRNLAYGLFLLVGLWCAWRRGEPRLLGILLLQGALIEFFDGLWLAYGKFDAAWTGQNTDFYMHGGFLWTPDLMLTGIFLLTRRRTAKVAA